MLLLEVAFAGRTTVVELAVSWGELGLLLALELEGRRRSGSATERLPYEVSFSTPITAVAGAGEVLQVRARACACEEKKGAAEGGGAALLL